MGGRIHQFFRRDLWEIDLRRTRGWRRAGLAALRVAAHTVRTFLADLGSLRAAGLTLVTLLALVPLLALVTGIAKGLGYGEVLDEELVRLIEQAPDGMRPAIEQIRALVQRTSFGALGAIGSALLAYSGLMLFVRVEQAFNHAWRVPQGRSWFRRLTDFVGLIVLVPILFLAALTLTSLLHGAAWFSGFPWLDQLYRAGLGLVPHLLAWLAFAALYKLMPSAKVKWTSAVVGGVVAGSGWLFLHELYLSTQISVARMNAIYATLAALPLLLVYLQVTWTIVLVGVEVCHAVQNRHALPGTRSLPAASFAMRLRLALHLTARVCDRFAAGDGGERLSSVASSLAVPEEWLGLVYDDLHRAGLLGRVAEEPDKVLPLRTPDQIRVVDVVDAIEGEIPEVLADRLALDESFELRLSRAKSAAHEVLSDGPVDQVL